MSKHKITNIIEELQANCQLINGILFDLQLISRAIQTLAEKADGKQKPKAK